MAYKTTLVTEDGIAVFIEVVKPDQAANLLTDCDADPISSKRKFGTNKKSGKGFPSEEEQDETGSTDLTTLFSGITPTSDNGETLPTNDGEDAAPSLYEVGFPVYVPNVTKVARTITLNRPSTATISINLVNLISRLRTIDDKLMKSVSSTARTTVDYENLESVINPENSDVVYDIRNIDVTDTSKPPPDLEYIRTLYGGYFDSFDDSVASQFIDAVYNTPTRDGAQSNLVADLIPELAYLARYAKLNTKKGDNLTSAFLDLYKRTKFNPFISDIYRTWIFVKKPPETSKHMARWIPYFGGYISNISTTYNAQTANWDVELSCQGTSSKFEESQIKTHYTVVNWVGRNSQDLDGNHEVLDIIQDASIRMSGAQSGAALQNMFSNKSLAGILHSGIQLTNCSRTYLGALGIYNYAHNEYLRKSDKEKSLETTTDAREVADEEIADNTQGLISDYWKSVADQLNIPRDKYFYYDYFYIPHRSDNKLGSNFGSNTLMYRLDIDTDNYDDKEGIYPRYSPYIPSDYVEKETNKANKAYAVHNSPWIFDYNGRDLDYPALHWEVEFLKNVKDVELAAKAWWFGIQESSIDDNSETEPEEDVEGEPTEEDYDGERDSGEDVQEETDETDNEIDNIYYYLSLPIRERWTPKIMLDHIIWKDPLFAMLIRKSFSLDDMGDRKTFLSILKEACAKIGCSFYDDPFGNLIVIQNRYDDLPYIYNPHSIKSTKGKDGSNYSPVEVDITFPGYCPFDNLTELQEDETQESEEEDTEEDTQNDGEGDSSEDIEGYEESGEEIEDEDSNKGFLQTDGTVVTGLGKEAKDAYSKDTFAEGIKKRSTYSYNDLPKFLFKDHDNRYIIGKDHFINFQTNLDPNAVYTFAKTRSEIDFLQFSGVLDLLYRAGFGGTSIATQLKYGVRILDNIPSILSTPNISMNGQTNQELMEIFSSSMLRVENSKAYSGNVNLNWQTLTMQPGRNIFMSPLCQKGFVIKLQDSYDASGSAKGNITLMSLVDIGKIIGNPYIEYQARNKAWKDTFDAYDETAIDMVSISGLDTAEEKLEWLRAHLDYPEDLSSNGNPEFITDTISVFSDDRLDNIESGLIDLTGNDNYDISAIPNMADTKHPYAREGTDKVTPQLTSSAKDRLDGLLEGIRLWVVRNYGEVDEDGNEDDSEIKITIDPDKFKIPILLTHSPIGHHIDFTGSAYVLAEDQPEWATEENPFTTIAGYGIEDINGYLDLQKDYGHWSGHSIKINIEEMTENDDGTEPTYMVFTLSRKGKDESGEDIWIEDEDKIYLPQDILQQVIEYQEYTEDDDVNGVGAISPYLEDYPRLSFMLGHLTLSKYTREIPNTETIQVTGDVRYQQSSRSASNINKVVIHYSADDSLDGAVDHLLKVGLSYHVLIGRNGDVHNMVDYENTALHAGSTSQEKYGYYDGNTETIGFCLIGTEASGFTDTQILILQGLVSRVCDFYNIPKKYPLKGVDGFGWDLPFGKSDGYYRETYDKIKAFSGIVGHQTLNKGKSDPCGSPVKLSLFDYRQFVRAL